MSRKIVCMAVSILNLIVKMNIYMPLFKNARCIEKGLLLGQKVALACLGFATRIIRY